MIVFVAIAVPLKTEANYLFYWNVEQVSRHVYSMNPFPESIKVGEYIASKYVSGRSRCCYRLRTTDLFL